MGKALIVSGGTDGQYTIKLLHNRARIDAEVAALTTRIAELEAELSALETEREALVIERNTIASEIDSAIDATPEGETPDVEALLVELAQVSARVQQIDAQIAMIKARKLVAIKRRDMLQSVPEDPQQTAWCADFTEDLTGEVATVEVPAEGVVGEFLTWRRAQIRPGFAGRATYIAARDGQMFHREGQVGYQAFYNAAILPGVQRWKPQYRIGVINAINYEADTCSLTIQGEDSSAQSLIIDPPDLQYSKTGVPIEYMDCNADPFEVGDRVLVEFQGRDWNQPKVIGFESNPRECPAEPRIFEIEVKTNNRGGVSFVCSPDNDTCAEGADGPGSWFSEKYFVAQATEDPSNQIKYYNSCEFDPLAANFEGACNTTSYFLTGTEVYAISGLGQNSISTGATIVGALADGFVSGKLDDVTVYASLQVDHSNHSWSGTYRRAGDTCGVCTFPTPTNQFSFSVPASALPDIQYDGFTWTPHAWVRIVGYQVNGFDGTTDPRTLVLRAVYFKA